MCTYPKAMYQVMFLYWVVLSVPVLLVQVACSSGMELSLPLQPPVHPQNKLWRIVGHSGEDFGERRGNGRATAAGTALDTIPWYALDKYTDMNTLCHQQLPMVLYAKHRLIPLALA